jgi:nicotinic acid phosphoribosyltransferase
MENYSIKFKNSPTDSFIHKSSVEELLDYLEKFVPMYTEIEYIRDKHPALGVTFLSPDFIGELKVRDILNISPSLDLKEGLARAFTIYFS